MRAALLMGALIIAGASSMAAPSLERLTMAKPASYPPTELAPGQTLPVEITPMRVKDPTQDRDDLTINPKTLTYISPDPYYAITQFTTSGRNGVYDVMSGYGEEFTRRFKGNKITTINVVVDDALDAVSVFIKDANFETIFEEEVDLEELDGYDIGCPDPWGKYAAVPVDYEIRDELFFVGYHAVIPEDAKYGQFRILGQMNNGINDLIYVTDNYSGSGPIGNSWLVPFIWCDTEGPGGLYTYDVGMDGITDYCRALCGSEYYVSGTLRNYGTEPVNSIKFSYTGPDGATEYKTLESSEPLPYMSGITFSFPIKANTEAGFFKKLVEVSDINGNPDDYAYDSSKISTLISIANPMNRVVVAEDYTGEWCGYCTRGMAGFELLNETYPNNVITAEYHVMDSMSEDLPGYRNVEVNGYPNAIVNHSFIADPWSGIDPALPFGMGDLVASILDMPVEMSLEAAASSDNNGNVAVKTQLTTSLDVPDGSIYEIGFTVVENNISGIQSNVYSNEYNYWPKDELPEAMWKYYDLPQQFEPSYQHVIRNCYGAFGNPGSVAASSIGEGESVGYEVEFPIDNVIDVYNAYVVAYVMDSSTKEILNAIMTPISNSSQVDEIAASYSIQRYSDGLLVTKEGNFYVEIYSTDGRLVDEENGNDSIYVSLPERNGVYIIVVSDGNGKEVQKFVF